MHDPKTIQKTSGDDLQAQVAALNAQVQALLETKTNRDGMSDDRLEAILLKVASVSAEAQERATNPSNRSHPGISVYSYPEGDRMRPRALRCPMFWAGYDLREDTTTADEIELLNQAKPGIYHFLRTDGSQETLTVTGVTNPDGTTAKLLFDFPTRERRDSLPSLVVMLRQAFGVKTPEQQELDRLRAELEQVKAQRVS